MHVELVELLRCVQPHEDICLVAAVDVLEDREIVRATLGCPICHAEYPIRDRVAYFAPSAEPEATRDPDPAGAMRVAAALELTDARATAVLHGAWGAEARLVRSVSPARLIVLNPATAIEPGDGVNVIVSGIAPLARGSVSGVALSADAGPDLVGSLAGALRAGGRMLAPIELAQPRGFTELARDDEVWVAERQRDDVIPLRRAPS
jgi:hypothetical protein